MDADARTVECPRCNHPNAAGANRCSSCGIWLGSDDATVTSFNPIVTKADTGASTDFNATRTSFDREAGWSKATRVGAARATPMASLEVGSVIAERYEIEKLLGEG